MQTSEGGGEWKQPQLRHDKHAQGSPPHRKTHQLELAPAEPPWMLTRLLHGILVNMRLKKKCCGAEDDCQPC